MRGPRLPAFLNLLGLPTRLQLQYSSHHRLFRIKVELKIDSPSFLASLLIGFFPHRYSTSTLGSLSHGLEFSIDRLKFYTLNDK